MKNVKTKIQLAKAHTFCTRYHNRRIVMRGRGLAKDWLEELRYMGSVDTLVRVGHRRSDPMSHSWVEAEC